MRRITEIPEQFEAISRPIAYDIIRKIGYLMHLPSQTEILLAGPMEQQVQAGSVLNYDGAPSKFPGGSRISVSVNEEINEQEVLSENALQENQFTVFLDKCLGVRLRPIYATTNITMSFEVRSRTRTEAEKIRDEFRMRAAMGRQQIVHALHYHYGIPDVFMELLRDIHGLREGVAGYGEIFETWLKNNGSDRLAQISNIAGNGSQWVFKERQVFVQGSFDFNISPEAPDKAGSVGEYNYPFQYKVRYDKPIGMSMDYEFMVHNQLLPSKWYGDYRAGGHYPEPLAGELYSDITNTVMRKLYLNQRFKPHQLMDGIHYPEFDDWIPTAVTPDTTTCYTSIIQVDNNDPHDVINLTYIDGVDIQGDILQYMAAQGSYLGVMRRAAVHVGLYKGKHWMGDDAIEVTSDLKVRSVKPMDQRSIYHIRLSVLNDLTRLTDEARLELRKHGKACQQILLTLQTKLPFGDYIPKLKGNGIVPDKILLESAKRINNYKQSKKTGLECHMLTLGNFFITAQRRGGNASVEDKPIGPETGYVQPDENPDLQQAVSKRC